MFCDLHLCPMLFLCLIPVFTLTVWSALASSGKLPNRYGSCHLLLMDDLHVMLARKILSDIISQRLADSYKVRPCDIWVPHLGNENWVWTWYSKIALVCILNTWLVRTLILLILHFGLLYIAVMGTFYHFCSVPLRQRSFAWAIFCAETIAFISLCFLFPFPPLLLKI